MTLGNTISKSEKLFSLVILSLAIFGFFYNLGISPFFLEEPRRGLIALEMILNDNYWVPTVMGDNYYKKPPVFNWMIVLSYKVFGYHEIAQRVVSILSLLGLSTIIFFFLKRRMGTRTALYSGLGYFLGVEFLFYYSLIGEIDLFYALVTSSSILAILHFGDKKKYWTLFLVVYFLTAVGFLTKGITSLPYTAVSLLVYFIYKKQFKMLLGIKHISGILLFGSLLGLYFWKYAQYAPVEEWINTLYSESADKATDGGFIEFIKHFLTFPFVALAIVFPATLFLMPLLRKQRFKKLQEDPNAFLCLLIFGFNFLLYWVSIGAQTRYIYPILPFLVIGLTSVAKNGGDEDKSLKVSSWVMCTLTCLALVGVFFVPNLDSVNNLEVSIIALIALTLGLGIFHYRFKLNNYLVVLASLVILKLAFSSIMPVVRAKDSGSAFDKRAALLLASLTGDETVYRYNGVIVNLKTAFYHERAKMEVLQSVNHFDGRFYIISKKDLPNDLPYETLYEVPYKQDDVLLIEMK